MKVIWRIAGKEFREMLRDRRFLWLGGVLFALLAASLAVGRQNFRSQSVLAREAAERQRERWLNKNAMPPHLAAHTGTMIFKQPTLLSAVDDGINSYVGTRVFLEAHKRNLFDGKAAENRATAERFGELTAARVLQLLVPLLIILLTFSTFAGERESGTLRQVLSLGVRRGELVFGKALGTIAPLLVFLALVSILGALALALNDSTGVLRISAARLSLLAASYFIYFVVIVGIGLIVSARSANSRRALLLLLAFWFVNCLVLPRLATEIGQRIHPTPSAREIAEAIEQDKKQLMTHFERRAEIERRLKEQYKVERYEDAPFGSYGFALYESEDDETRINREHYNRLFDIYERQNRFYQFAAIFAPGIASNSLSSAFAGSDWAHHRHFADATEQYRYLFVQTLNGHIKSLSHKTQYDSAGRELYEKVPPFAYTAPDANWSLRRSLPSVLLLAAWLVGVIVAVPFALARMSVD